MAKKNIKTYNIGHQLNRGPSYRRDYSLDLNADPVTLDTALLDLLEKARLLGRRVDNAQDTVWSLVAKRIYTKSRNSNYPRVIWVWKDSNAAKLFRIDWDDEIAKEDIALWDDVRKSETVVSSDAYKEYKTLLRYKDRCWDACDDIEREYQSRPWKRYYLVVSSDGHIHKNCNCSTCNNGKNPTQFTLFPQLSGKSAKDAVDTLGPALCSVCFSEAPVEDKQQVKVSSKLALILKEKGVEAYDKAVAEAAERKAKRESKYCEASGQKFDGDVRVEYNWNGRADRYGTCPCCKRDVKVTKAGKIAKHARPRFVIQEDYYDSKNSGKYWTGESFGFSKQALVLSSRSEAQKLIEEIAELKTCRVRRDF
jgi:hypothetical protein